jgi:hypothetical protein
MCGTQVKFKNNRVLFLEYMYLSPFVEWVLVQVIFTEQNSINKTNRVARWPKATSNPTLDLQSTKKK